VDTEEDPVVPITPLHCARFDLSRGPLQQQPGKDKSRQKETVGDAYAELEGDNGFVNAGREVEIEDNWVDPVTPPPALKKRDVPGRWFDVGIKVGRESWERRMRKQGNRKGG
jgi:hypothetical protein